MKRNGNSAEEVIGGLSEKRKKNWNPDVSILINRYDKPTLF